jgi:hypothetical protein
MALSAGRFVAILPPLLEGGLGRDRTKSCGLEVLKSRGESRYKGRRVVLVVLVAVVAISSCAGRNTERKALEGEKRQCAGRMVAFRMGKCKSKECISGAPPCMIEVACPLTAATRNDKPCFGENGRSKALSKQSIGELRVARLWFEVDVDFQSSV